MYGLQPEMNHLHGVCDPHMNGLSLQVNNISKQNIVTKEEKLLDSVIMVSG